MKLMVLSFFLFVANCSPTFKTATPTSRTQLKQQLQREQLQELERQELERRENERKNSIIARAGGLNPVISQKMQLPDDIQQLRSQYGSANLFIPSPSASTSTVQTAAQYTAAPEQTQPQNPVQNIPGAPLKLPLHIDVDLPSQVLKVSTILSIAFFAGIKQMLCELLGADSARESNQISCHSEAKESGPPIPERIVPAVGLE